MSKADESPQDIDTMLLHLLLTSREPLSVDAIAKRFHHKHAWVRGQFDALREAGCELEITPHMGVRLERTGIGCWLDYLRHRHPRRIVEVYARTASTQDAARRVIDSCGNDADFAIIVADFQSAGRGRLGRRWSAPAGKCLLFSCVCRVDATQTIDRLVFASSVAIAAAVEAVTEPNPLDVRIKWPNDLMVNDRKLAGILVETHVNPAQPEGSINAIIGIGINVTLTEDDLGDDAKQFTNSLASLLTCGHRIDRLRLLDETITQLDAAIHMHDMQPLIDQWQQRSTHLSQHVHLKSNGRDIRGHVVGLDPHDGLIVRTDAGELLHLRAATTTHA